MSLSLWPTTQPYSKRVTEDERKRYVRYLLCLFSPNPQMTEHNKEWITPPCRLPTRPLHLSSQATRGVRARHHDPSTSRLRQWEVFEPTTTTPGTPSRVLSDGGRFAPIRFPLERREMFAPTTSSKRVTTSVKGTLVTCFFSPLTPKWQNTTRRDFPLLVNLFSADTTPPPLVSSNGRCSRPPPPPRPVHALHSNHHNPQSE